MEKKENKKKIIIGIVIIGIVAIIIGTIIYMNNRSSSNVQSTVSRLEEKKN